MNFSLHWGGLQLSVVLSWYPRLVGNELLPQVMDFKYFGVLFMSEKMREMSMIVKLSIYWLIYASTLTYNHERRVVTETMRLQATEMTFFWKLSRKSRVPTPHTEIGQLRLFWHLQAQVCTVLSLLFQPWNKNSHRRYKSFVMFLYVCVILENSWLTVFGGCLKPFLDRLLVYVPVNYVWVDCQTAKIQSSCVLSTKSNVWAQ